MKLLNNLYASFCNIQPLWYYFWSSAIFGVACHFANPPLDGFLSFVQIYYIFKLFTHKDTDNDTPPKR